MLETEERKKMYEQAGISVPVFEYGEKITKTASVRSICMERQDMVTMTVDATPWKKCTPIFFMPKMLW